MNVISALIENSFPARKFVWMFSFKNFIMISSNLSSQSVYRDNHISSTDYT